MNHRRFTGMALCSLLALGGVRAQADDLGVTRGIDHIGNLVRLENFAAAAEVWTHQLGFTATPVLTSDAGVENRLIWLEGTSYLELDAFTADNPGTAPFLAFLADHEGAKFYGTAVRDASAASTFLTGAGYPNTGPIPAGPLTVESTGQVVGATPLWNELILTSVVAPDNSTFFLAYDEPLVHQLFHQVPALAPAPHANTARRIRTVWLVVSDLDAAVAFYRGLGLRVADHSEAIDYLGARGTRVQMRNATLTLLQPSGPGLVADFVADRTEGILGYSIVVRELDRAHHLVEENTGLTLPIFRHHGRARFLVPASQTHGVLLEMIE